MFLWKRSMYGGMLLLDHPLSCIVYLCNFGTLRYISGKFGPAILFWRDAVEPKNQW